MRDDDGRQYVYEDIRHDAFRDHAAYDPTQGTLSKQPSRMSLPSNDFDIPQDLPGDKVAKLLELKQQ